jgi:predicted PurR-regulated permease PerM
LATAKQARPYATAVFAWLAGRAGGVGWVLLQFVLTVIIAAIMYAYGETAAAGLRRFGRRLAGDRGEQMMVLAARSVRGVALGIVVTAFVQSVIGGLALALAGVPFALVLTSVMFFLCIAQLGPVLVLVPAILWL